MAAEFGGGYCSHIRNESFAVIDSARAGGMDVTADIYPYVRKGIGLGSFVHPRHYAEGQAAFRDRLGDPAFRAELRREIEETAGWEIWFRWSGSDWENVLIVRAPGEVAGDVVGRSLAGAAEALGEDPWDLFFELVHAGGVSVAPLSKDEEQKHRALERPWVMIDTDASPVNPENVDATHPRAFGAFPRVIARYVREDGILELEEAVRRMTSLAANRLGLSDRGRIAPGMAADLVVFHPERIQDRATFTGPLRYAEGVDHLIINGEMVIQDGQLTGALPGRALRRGR